MRKLFTIDTDLLGEGRVKFEWSPKGHYLAAVGQKRKVSILDRNGKVYDEVHLPPPELPINEPGVGGCVQIQWDPSGENLAMIPSGNSFILIWVANSKEVQKIDTEFKTQDFCIMSWNKKGDILAAGTSKGNLLLYNSRERKKTPIVGKHTKKIVSALWNRDNILTMAGQDRQVTITDGLTGETLKAFTVKADPYELCVADKKDDGASKREENTWTVNVGRKTIYLLQITREGDKPVELAFLDQYGPIQKHTWFGDGYILVGFRSGNVVVVSTHSREISEEVHSGKYLDVLTDFAVCPALARIALAGANQVKLLDAAGTEYAEIRGDAIELDGNCVVDKVGWTRDGQVLTVATEKGQLLSFLAALPLVYDSCGTKALYLTSLLEMSVSDVHKRGASVRIDLQTEPAFCGLGPSHAAVGMNNQVWLYRHSGSTVTLVNRRDYLGSVSAIKLTDKFAAVLTEGRVIVHPIEVPEGQAPEDNDMVLPGQGQPATICSLAITTHFVITGNRSGLLAYYLLPDLTPVNEFRHDEGAIVRLFPQPSEGRLLYEDDKRGVYLFNPVNDHVLPLPQFQGPLEGAMWDVSEHNFFLMSDGSYLYAYLHCPVSISGPVINPVGKQGLPPTHTPLVVSNGLVACRLKNGTLDNITLETHRAIQSNDALSRAAPQRRFQQTLLLYRLKDAWDCALSLKLPEHWKSLGTAALEVLELDMAVAAYRMLGDASMVLSLERVRQYEDKNLLAAHVLVLLERDYGQAQELFLRSSQPKAALEMRKDLKHWSEALKLAEQLDPDAIPLISKEHAAMLELTGEYSSAKAHYQNAMDALVTVGEDPALQLACQEGLARTTLHMGDIRAGRAMVQQLNSIPLYKDCALILENLNQLQESAEMYERAGMYEKAASIFIQTKNFNAAAPLMAKISSSKLQLQFAKAKEAEGKYQEAVVAYEAAGEMDAVVRLCLEQLGNAQKAYSIARKTQSIDAATMLYKYALQKGDFQGAVEFLLMANQMDQAFDIAQQHSEMDTFARIVASGAKAVDFQKIAMYYESRGEYEKAGEMWERCDQDPRAVQLYLKVGSNSALEKAIGIVERSKNNSLGIMVLDYVNEEKDGAAKDEYRFKLNIAMGLFMEAAKDAMEMARFEQEEGNYRVAHDKLFATYKQLEGLGYKPPSELVRALMLLHSYTLVKSLIAINDHITAARMLVRVARNISKFPKHVVPILTSTVIECHRAGLKKTAFEYASMLMRPEYRNLVAAKYKKKIELMVRKPDKSEEAEEVLVDCPFCNMPGPETELQCVSCQNIIPFDIATGKRMSLADWAQCPTCTFPASGAQFVRILSVEFRCPMCNEEVKLDQIRKVQNPIEALRAQSTQPAT